MLMPENRGNAVSYAGGRTHRPLPSATDKTYRDTHEPQPPKPTSTFDWDWNKTACSSCETKVGTGTLVGGVCRTCRGEPAVVAPAPTREAYSPYEDDELDTIYQPAHDLPDVPDLPEAEPVDEPTVVVPSAAQVARDLRAPSPPAVQGVDLLEECILHAERTFRAAHGIQDPLVGILRTAALSAIAALDFYVALHCTDSRGTAEPPTDGAASTTTPAHAPELGGTQPAADPRGEARQRPARARGVRRPAIEVDEAAIVREYINDRDSAPTIARRHGVLPKRIRQILAAHGVQLRDDRAGHSGGSNRKVWDQAVTDDVVRRYGEGQTIANIALGLSAGRRQVARCLRDAGVTLRPPVSVTSPIDDETRAEILRRYVEAEETLNQVAAALHLRVERVKDVVVAAGITVRPRGGAPRELIGRLATLGVTSHDVKTWAVEQGLIHEIARGMVPARLVDAYVNAHTQEGPAA